MSIKLKRAKIVVQPIAGVKAEWGLALKGGTKREYPEGTIFFTSLTAVAKALSPTRLELLGAILRQKPESIYALAKIVERDFKNVYGDVRILSQIGLIELIRSDSQGVSEPGVRERMTGRQRAGRRATGLKRGEARSSKNKSFRKSDSQGRQSLKPVAKYRGIEVDLVA